MYALGKIFLYLKMLNINIEMFKKISCDFYQPVLATFWDITVLAVLFYFLEMNWFINYRVETSKYQIYISKYTVCM